jgi:hypothetical protein
VGIPERGIDRLGMWNRDAVLPLLAEAQRPSIAIVGNGPLPESVVEEVEAATVVVRFNNWATRRGLDQQRNHAGDHCDILVSNFDIHNERLRQPRQVVLGIPWPHHQADASRLLDTFYDCSSAFMVNPWWMDDCHRAIECPHPTVGLTALYCLSRMALPAAFKVFGFTWHFDPAHRTMQGVPLTVPSLPGSWRHHYPREARWVGENLLHDPAWSFDAPAQAALEAVMERCWPWMLAP